MKKLFLTLITLLILCPQSYAVCKCNKTWFVKPQIFNKCKVRFIKESPCEEIKKTLNAHLEYANNYNLKELQALYSDKYINVDGLNKEIYFDLIKKTWESYPDIRYKLKVKHIEVNDNMAVAQVKEYATATTSSKSALVNKSGVLESISDSVYYFEKVNNQWLVVADYILFEKTFLKYGSAKDIDINLVAPSQILAGSEYTASLKIEPPKDAFIIASIGHENITYPQSIAEEVFRKLPESGILERIFQSNNENINEYAVASFGITKAEIKNNREIKIYVTGLGFVMLRVNVIPKNNFIKVSKNEETK